MIYASKDTICVAILPALEDDNLMRLVSTGIRNLGAGSGSSTVFDDFPFLSCSMSLYSISILKCCQKCELHDSWTVLGEYARQFAVFFVKASCPVDGFRRVGKAGDEFDVSLARIMS